MQDEFPASGVRRIRATETAHLNDSLLIENQQPHPLRPRIDVGRHRPGLHALARYDAGHVARPDLAERDRVAGEFGSRDGGLGGPAGVVAVDGDVPLRVPGLVAPTVLGERAALVDLEAEIGLIVAVEVEHNRNAVEVAQVHVAVALADLWRLLAGRVL